MFDATRPPLLVLPVKPQQAHLFPPEEGYKAHHATETETYVGYKSGWILPLSVRQKSEIAESPLLLVRDKGSVTAEGGNFKKGYAHRFILDDGTTPASHAVSPVFPNNNEDWLLVPGYVNAVWLQYGFRNQVTDGEGFITENHSGTLIIFKFKVALDYAPSLDRKANMPEKHDCMYRVGEERLLHEEFSVSNTNLVKVLNEILRAKGFAAFNRAVESAVIAAGYR